MINVLFVCMGNICRSPTAEGVFNLVLEKENMTDKFRVDSAGTHGYHVGSRPDQRSMQVAMKKGIDISQQTSRKIDPMDFEMFDYLLAMDNANFEDMKAICPVEYRHKISLFLPFSSELGMDEVPDPYHGGQNGFETVFDMLQIAAKALFFQIKKEHSLK